MEDWAEIRRLHRAEGMPIRAICRQLGIGRNTVRRALAADAPPKYRRARAGSIVDEVEPRIRELLAAWHHVEQYANNRIEADHSRLKHRLRSMRGLRTDRTARVIVSGLAFIQNLRRGHYELAVETPRPLRVAAAFTELAQAI